MPEALPKALQRGGSRPKHAPHLEVIEGPTDEELLKQFVSGDQSAFDTIVIRYRDRLLRKAVSLTNNTENAEDLVQHAFVQLMRDASKIHGIALQSWLYRVITNSAYNLTRDTGRRRKKVHEHPEQVPMGTIDVRSPEERVLQGQRREQLLAVLHTLPPHQAEILQLRYMEDLENAEIAERLNIPAGTVASRLSRAKEALATAMAAHGIVEEDDGRKIA